MMRRVTVLVCGEPMRGDDAVADAVVRRLRPTTLALVRVEHVGQLTPDHLLAAPGPVILLDAVEGPPAGEVIDLPLGSLLSADTTGVRPASSHGVPMPIVVGIADRLRGGLPEGRFIGVAGAQYVLGAPLSDAVQDAVPRCAGRLDHWARVLAHGTRRLTCA